MLKKLALALPVLLFTGVIFVSGCDTAPSNLLLGKWESNGAPMEFTEKEAILPGGGSCPVEGYAKDMKQINGKQFLIITYTCIDEKKGSKFPLAVMMLDDDTLIAFSEVWHRLN